MGHGRIGVFTSGLWRLRDRVALLTGLTPTRRHLSARGLQAVAGWGHKPTAAHARACARAAGLPYIAIEDGFFRSRRPGDAERSASHVCDAEGVYYDAAGPSALERLTRARLADPAAAAAAAAPALEAMRLRGLSKYTEAEAGPEAFRELDAISARTGGRLALVIDQTAGDAAVAGAGADAARFRAMLAAAAAENPNSALAIKTHPETRAGRRRGHLDAAAVATVAAACPELADARAAGRVLTLDASMAPMAVLTRADRVYAVSSLMGFEALAAGRPVVCFGQAFYAGWGLTDDRGPATERRRPVPFVCLAAAAFADYTRYFDPETGAPCDMAHAIDRLLAARGPVSLGSKIL
jgi:capsule polysaccharide export protein KpsC/LpsZ